MGNFVEFDRLYTETIQYYAWCLKAIKQPTTLFEIFYFLTL